MPIRASLASCLLGLTLTTSLGLAACGDDSGSGPDAAAASCDDYCTTVTTNCTGAESQYTSRDQCLAVCAAFPGGAPGDQSGNSLECRDYHAGAALSDPATHCVHAGPSGAGVCGTDCEGFCTVVMSACTGANEAYASLDDCLTACGDFVDTEPYDSSDTSGDTLACRLYHGAVATSDPATHCVHTQPTSATCF